MMATVRATAFDGRSRSVVIMQATPRADGRLARRAFAGRHRLLVELPGRRGNAIEFWVLPRIPCCKNGLVLRCGIEERQWVHIHGAVRRSALALNGMVDSGSAGGRRPIPTRHRPQRPIHATPPHRFLVVNSRQPPPKSGSAM
jgi:hypothetical protein